MAYELDLAQVWNAIAPMIKGTPQRQQHEAALKASEAQTGYTQTLQQRLSQLTPAEIAQMHAQSGVANAQASALQGGEARAGRREGGELMSLDLDNLMKRIQSYYQPEAMRANIGYTQAQTGEAGARGRLYGAEAEAVPTRLSLERDALTQRGDLGTRELDLREQGNYADLLGNASMMYPPNQALIRHVMQRLGVEETEPLGGGMDPGTDKRLSALEQYLKSQRGQGQGGPQKIPSRFDTSVTPIGPGAPAVGAGYRPDEGTQPSAQTPRRESPRIQYQLPRQQQGVTPIGPGAPGVVGEDRSLEEAVAIIRNIMRHGGMR